MCVSTSVAAILNRRVSRSFAATETSNGHKVFTNFSTPGNNSKDGGAVLSFQGCPSTAETLAQNGSSTLLQASSRCWRPRGILSIREETLSQVRTMELCQRLLPLKHEHQIFVIKPKRAPSHGRKSWSAFLMLRNHSGWRFSLGSWSLNSPQCDSSVEALQANK